MPLKRTVLVYLGTLLLAIAPAWSNERLENTTRAFGNALVLEMDGKAHTLSETGNSISREAVRTNPGSKVVTVTWRETDQKGITRDYYAISLDRRGIQTTRVANYNLMMRNNHFDPLERAPGVAANMEAPTGSNLYIVQYWTQGLEHYRSQVSRMGGEVHRFLPMNGELVEMDARTADRVAGLPFVRYVGPYHLSFKMDETIQQLVAKGYEGSLRVNILSMRRGSVGQSPVLERIWSMGGEVNDVSPETYLFNATMNMSQLMEVASMDSVQWIDIWSAPENDMDIARDFHGADYVESVAGYTGQGVRVEVMDGGCDEGHPDLQNYVIHNNNTPSAHGTATSGIVLGSGANNFAARGVMPDAFLSIADYNYISGGSRYNHTAELQDPGDVYRSVLQSNSWGDARTLSYNSISQDMDLILFDHNRISILQSQSNAGNQQSRPQAWAKNIISVGGIRHYGTLSKSDDAWAGGASIGPAADGRIKPDLASFYDSTLCTDQVGSAGYASGDYYSSFGGTSGATPIVAGHLGLIYQMWSDGIFGNATPGSTVFENRPYNTTAKALLINTSTQWNFSGTGDDLTRTHQGWGHPDLVKTYDLRNKLYIVDESDILTNLSSTVHSVDVAAGTPEFKATMIYNDLPGTTSSSQHRINDLNLKVTSPGGTVYWGNNGLLANMYSTSGGSPNSLDTVENVFIQNPQAGAWQVEVIAAELNGDGHAETGAVDADYALVVSGVDNGSVGPQAPNASFTYNANQLSVSFDASGSNDPDGSIVSYDWTFGDGNSGSGVNPTHAYAASGTYTVTLTVTDNDGLTDSASQSVTVSDSTPPLSLGANGYKVKGVHTIDLNWSGGAGDATVDIYRNGSLVATVTNNGAYTDSTGNKGKGTYVYEVCDSGGCSNQVTVAF